MKAHVEGDVESMAHAIVVIPARYAASRFPGKLLSPLKDRPVIQWVWEGARSARLVDEVLVATDDERIAAAVNGFGGKVVMTSPDIRSGTDRVAHAVRDVQCDIVINVQGDEPLVTGSSLDGMVQALERDPEVDAATLREPVETVGDLFDPNIVKVVATCTQDALFFSRTPIPYFRTEGNLHADFRAVLFGREQPVEGYYRHVGIYAFRKSSLLEFASTAQTPLEKAEGLEQLRLLETGRRLKLIDSDFRSIAIDTIPDLRRALLVIEGREGGRVGMP
jgi:3-deoxy-manno-octulosonate cytidylyltransferase (CMP-KDO synthetase)